MCSIERLFARMFVRLRCGVSCAMCGHVPLYAIMSVHVVAVVVTTWLWPSCPGCRGVPGCGRRDVAMASLGVAVACRGRGCGVRRLCVAVVWLRHADER